MTIDDGTLQLVPCCYRFKIPRFEEQNINIYIFKSLCCHQSFPQKSLDGNSGSAAFIVCVVEQLASILMVASSNPSWSSAAILFILFWFSAMKKIGVNFLVPSFQWTITEISFSDYCKNYKLHEGMSKKAFASH